MIYPAIWSFDDIVSHHPDLFCLTETWIKNSTTCAELKDCTPPNYTFLSTPRTSSKGNSSAVVGGGTGFLIREPFTQLSTSVPQFSSFEHSSVTLKLPQSKISFFNIYRPPSSSPFSKPFSFFLDEFNSFLSVAATTPHEFVITGSMLIFQRTAKTTFLTWLLPRQTPLLRHLYPPHSVLHPITSLFSLNYQLYTTPSSNATYILPPTLY